MRSPRRSANEQYDLIMECRSSGLSDQQWCLQHDINPGTFYNWVKRLKAKKCYDIPPATGRDGLTASVKQDVVKVEILPDPSGQIHETAVSAHSTDTEQIRPQPLTAPIEIHLMKPLYGSQMMSIPGFWHRSSEVLEDVYARRYFRGFRALYSAAIPTCVSR
jgi:transposase-like protein